MKTYSVIKKVVTSFASIWISYVFLFSLTFKFSGDPETQNIFGTIWKWMTDTLWETIGNWFTNYWAYVIWSGELIISIFLLIPVRIIVIKMFWWLKSKMIPEYLFALWGLWAVMIMSWAIFFHLFTPLGIEVNGDGWSLFKAAVSIWVLGVALFVTYFKSLWEMITKIMTVSWRRK